MHFVVSVFKRIFLLFQILILKFRFGNRIFVGKNVRLHRNTEIVVYEGCRLIIGCNVSSRKNLSLFVTDEAKIVGGGYMSIGNNCFFNRNCSFTALNRIEIGNDCIFGENVHVYDHNHNYKNFERLIREQGFNSAPVIIGNNCWIGTNAVILKGVTVGENSIIGAGCIVYKDVPANSILLSNGKVVRK